MTATRSISRKSWALLTALMLFAALVVPVLAAQKAEAATPDNVCKLDVSLETASNATGRTHTLTAVVDPDATCTDAAGAEVDFEIESGPAARVNVTGDAGVGGTASDDGNTPLTPDLTCTTPAVTGGGANVQCTVTFTSDTAGTHVIRAWVDDDKDSSTLDFDATEGQLEGTTPGSRTEPDDTDVVTKTWFATLAANASLDCTPEEATNPATGAGNVETYTCTLFNDNGDDNGDGLGIPSNGIKDGTEAGIAGVLIDGENRTGANDPDDSNVGTADYNDVGTTNASGQVTFNVGASESSPGAADLCFWADADADTDASGTSGQIDGSGCGELQATVDSNVTDVVTKTWVAVGTAASVTLTPESAQNIHSTSHTVTATVEDAFGTPVAGAFVDFNVSGHNAKAQEQSVTNASGQVTFTYTDTAAVHTGNPDTDTILACIDNNANNTASTGCSNDGGTTGDSVSKFWFTTAPTAAEVVYDPGADGTDCENTDALTDTEAPTNAVGTRHTKSCASVFNATNQPIPGEVVTFTSSGPGQFHNDVDGDGIVDAGELVDTITVTTNATGDAPVTLYSTESGTQTVTATADAQSDSGTKTWTTAATNARNIELTVPAEAEVGTIATASALVTDVFGNPVPGVSVTFSETGPAIITSANPATTDANGVAEVLYTSGVEGTSTVSATITTGGTQCAQPAGTPVGATAGNCTDSGVTEWTPPEPKPQCNNGIDDDGDGFIDYPFDPGCENQTDNDEADHVIDGHNRSISIRFVAPQHRRDGLIVKGRVTVNDSFNACRRSVPVKVQRRTRGQWVTRKSTTTNRWGWYAVEILPTHSRFRAVATRFLIFDADTNTDNVCKTARKVKRYRGRL